MQKQRGWTRQHETHNSRRTQSPEELVFQLDQSDFWAIRLDCTLLFTCFTRWLSSRTAAACLESAAYVSETVTGAAGPGFTPAVRVEDPPGRGTFLNLYIIFPQEKKSRLYIRCTCDTQWRLLISDLWLILKLDLHNRSDRRGRIILWWIRITAKCCSFSNYSTRSSSLWHSRNVFIS